MHQWGACRRPVIPAGVRPGIKSAGLCSSCKGKCRCFHMGNSNLLPYETIVRATNGEPEAVDEVLRHYSKRIRIAAALAKSPLAKLKVLRESHTEEIVTFLEQDSHRTRPTPGFMTALLKCVPLSVLPGRISEKPKQGRKWNSLKRC